MEPPTKEQSTESPKTSSPDRPKALTIKLTPQQMGSLSEHNALITITSQQLRGLQTLWFALQRDQSISIKSFKGSKPEGVDGMSLQLSPEQIQQANASKRITLTHEILAYIIDHWVADEPYEPMPSSPSRSSSNSVSSTPKLLSPERSGEQAVVPETPSDELPSTDLSSESAL